MPATFTEGDLFARSDIRAWAHGCNCAGAMGAGIAVEFKRRFPRMFEEYKLRCADGRFGLGDVFVWSEGELTVYNLGTQEHWRKKAQLPALSKAVGRMVGARRPRLAESPTSPGADGDREPHRAGGVRAVRSRVNRCNGRS
jgi:O-acetyl-ADP-ribose deacetylase (regulator of RNase III)